jgi:putative methionine-R-sulfoxide reductase with GAF domain
MITGWRPGAHIRVRSVDKGRRRRRAAIAGSRTRQCSMRNSRSRSQAPATASHPRDVEALEEVIAALGAGVPDERAADRVIVSTLTEKLGFAYGAAWGRRADGSFAVTSHVGSLESVLGGVLRPDGTLGPDDGMLGVAVQRRQPVLIDGDGDAQRCLRWRAAREAGMRSGCVLPVVQDGTVVAVYEFYTPAEMPFFGARAGKWQALARIAAMTRKQALVVAELEQAVADRYAVTAVVDTIGAAPDVHAALAAGLETVRSAFGWAYGSYWALDETSNVLRFEVESGSAGEEFRRITLEASFAEGVGLSGRAWQRRSLVFVPDLSEMTDCVRAPAAQRAGVRSGVCFPIMIDDRVVGTMDFFTTETIALSESRASALSNVQQLLSQRVAVLSRVEKDADRSRELLQTVYDMRAAADRAGEVAAEVASRTQDMTANVAQLSEASTAINDVIKLISTIASQTNLLALNATIESARAGEAGKGFAVVANEVKELARETGEATTQVSEQIAAIQHSGEAVAAGIAATRETVEKLDAVQARIAEVLAVQSQMASVFDS